MSYVLNTVMTSSTSSSSSFRSPFSSPRWTHSSRGAPLLYAVPGRPLSGRDQTAEDRSTRAALAACAESATIATEWLEQGLEALSIDRHAAVVGTISGLIGEVRAVHLAVARVAHHRDDAALARFFAAASPLHAYLADVYAWSEGICTALDEIAVAVRRGEPARTIFMHRAINASYTRLEAGLRAALADLSAGTCAASAASAQALDTDLEEALWATTWLHLSLTKRFGE